MTKENRERQKVTVACQNCRKRKAKCSGKPKCTRCQINHLNCEFTKPEKKRGPPKTVRNQDITPFLAYPTGSGYFGIPVTPSVSYEFLPLFSTPESSEMKNWDFAYYPPYNYDYYMEPGIQVYQEFTSPPTYEILMSPKDLNTYETLNMYPVTNVINSYNTFPPETDAKFNQFDASISNL
ncbi:11306_t:CDS:1 [Acaulospora morrowiae]|uniref:11306_t:CDS:1 n=1 Tax=Acaulospora morrowiae TaxID=94023 RepID=A0A9N9FX29_9GLOM|nr:11306_t:CDS:1 [Acaulospora morrowiae]